jgi:hypothetical protein
VSSAFRRRAAANLVRALAVAAAAAAAGCYEAAVGIDASPQAQNDARLLGRWTCGGQRPNENTFTITAAAATARTYTMTFQEKGEPADHLEGFVSTVKDSTFINVRKIDPSSPPAWNILRYSFARPDVVELRVVQETLFKGTAGPVRATLERELSNPALFDEQPPTVCRRKGK